VLGKHRQKSVSTASRVSRVARIRPFPRRRRRPRETPRLGGNLAECPRSRTDRARPGGWGILPQCLFRALLSSLAACFSAAQRVEATASKVRPLLSVRMALKPVPNGWTSSVSPLIGSRETSSGAVLATRCIRRPASGLLQDLVRPTTGLRLRVLPSLSSKSPKRSSALFARSRMLPTWKPLEPRFFQSPAQAASLRAFTAVLLSDTWTGVFFWQWRQAG
jgi:hypothetical protein